MNSRHHSFTVFALPLAAASAFVQGVPRAETLLYSVWGSSRGGCAGRLPAWNS